MLIGLAIWILVASIATAALYAWDKSAAVKDHRRISERTLLLWSVLGGWPGALMASRWLRHKTKKVSFRIQFVTCIVLNLVIVGAIITFGLPAK